MDLIYDLSALDPTGTVARMPSDKLAEILQAVHAADNFKPSLDKVVQPKQTSVSELLTRSPFADPSLEIASRFIFDRSQPLDLDFIFSCLPKRPQAGFLIGTYAHSADICLLVDPTRFQCECDAVWNGPASSADPFWLGSLFAVAALGVQGLPPDHAVVPGGTTLARTWIRCATGLIAQTNFQTAPTLEALRALLLLKVWWLSDGDGRHLASLDNVSTEIAKMVLLFGLNSPLPPGVLLRPEELDVRCRLGEAFLVTEALTRSLLGRNYSLGSIPIPFIRQLHPSTIIFKAASVLEEINNAYLSPTPTSIPYQEQVMMWHAALTQLEAELAACRQGKCGTGAMRNGAALLVSYVFVQLHLPLIVRGVAPTKEDAKFHRKIAHLHARKLLSYQGSPIALAKPSLSLTLSITGGLALVSEVAEYPHKESSAKIQADLQEYLACVSSQPLTRVSHTLAATLALVRSFLPKPPAPSLRPLESEDEEVGHRNSPSSPASHSSLGSSPGTPPTPAVQITPPTPGIMGSPTSVRSSSPGGVGNQEYIYQVQGPFIIGWAFMLMLYGVAVNMTSNYVTSSLFAADSRRVKFLVGSCFFFLTFQAVVEFGDLYYWSTMQQRSVEGMDANAIWDGLSLLGLGVVAVQIQSFLLWRTCQLIKNRIGRLAFGTVIGLGIALAFAANLLYTVTIMMNYLGEPLSDTEEKVNGGGSLAFLSSAVVDLVICTSLAYVLLRERKSFNVQSDTILKTLAIVSLQSGAYTTLFAMVAAILVYAMPWTYWYNIFSQPLAPLYMIALLTSLQGRQRVRDIKARDTTGGLAFSLPPVTYELPVSYDVTRKEGSAVHTLSSVRSVGANDN
ncbi:hypothetical protein MNV49_006101 [Pseudohyphozyma bogoriensis]|nr:hypothetical protein MNV49_006101 [Pseudohyphozyma bogoriensis]